MLPQKLGGTDMAGGFCIFVPGRWDDSRVDEGMLIATWWGVAVAGLIGAGGLVVGIVGLAQAHKAKKAAIDANKLSAEANTIAREANNMSRQTAARDDELHDVAWEWRYHKPNPSMVEIRNIGKNTAYGVRAQFFYEDVVEANDAPQEVPGRETILLQIPKLGDAINESRRKRQTIPLGNGTSIISQEMFDLFWTRLRVTWRTELGTPKF